jgi:hypothetical protein
MELKFELDCTGKRSIALEKSATVADTKGGKEWNKNWYLQGNKDT